MKTLVALAVLVAVVALARNNGLADSATLGALMVVSGLVARLLLRDLRKHPANFPKPAPSHGPRIAENPQGKRGSPRWRTIRTEQPLNE